MRLSEEQQYIADAILRGESVAILCEAGYGKTYTLKSVLPKLKGVMVVAPTGAAAVNIGLGATTVHRAFGLKPTIQDPSKFSNKLTQKVANVLKRVKVLVIEEVGGVRRDLFEAMDFKLRQAKECDLPFGGCQVILLGDVGQTSPPVNNTELHHYRRFYNSVWFFTSPSFKGFKVYTLNKNERNTDERQNRIMKSVRNKDKHCELALKRLWEESTPYTPNSDKMVMCQFNKDADAINGAAYHKNKNTPHVYRAVDKGKVDNLKAVPVPAQLSLKEGLKVMLISNDEGGVYVNGDTGVIVACQEDCVIVHLDRLDTDVMVTPFTYEVVEYKARGMGLSVSVLASRQQLPIKLGYASTIHKLQGKTLDSAVIDMGTLPEHFTMPATFYVAITRVRDLRNLSFVRPPKMSDVVVDEEALKFYQSITCDSQI